MGRAGRPRAGHAACTLLDMEVGNTCGPAECRILLDAAHREISRLRQGMLEAADRVALERVAATPPDPLSSPPTKARPYAPPPLAEPTPRDAEPPEPAAGPPRPQGYYVTNQWSLVDVLA